MVDFGDGKRGGDALTIRWAPEPGRFRAGAAERLVRIYDPVVRAATRAYWRELADPDSPQRDAQPSLPARAARAGSPILSAAELLRALGSEHASVLARPEPEGPCEHTSARLAALAAAELDAGERRELAEHLERCLLCQAVLLKTRRAERAFATRLAAPAAVTLVARDGLGIAAARSAEPTTRPAADGGGPGAGPATGTHLEAAVRAYCRELEDQGTGERAAAIIGALDANALGSAPATPECLLWRTRTIAAEQVRATAGPDAACRATAPRLAARANGELGADERQDFEGHLGDCLACQGTALRAARADRAFLTILGQGPGLA